jgi:protein-disulfide isomerase
MVINPQKCIACKKPRTQTKTNKIQTKPTTVIFIIFSFSPNHSLIECSAPLNSSVEFWHVEVYFRTLGISNHSQNTRGAVANGISRSHMGKSDRNPSSKRAIATISNSAFNAISSGNPCASSMGFLPPSIFPFH